MAVDPKEVERRKHLARAAIERTFANDLEESSARLFVTHHIAEVEASYWLCHLATETPAAEAVLGLLEFKSHWGEDSELEVFDFTLPGGVTQYVVCVRFDERGEVLDVAMES